MFKSWRAYLNFERGIMFDRRYVRSADNEEFLDAVLATASARKVSLKKGSIYWRAQLGHDLREEGEGNDAFEVKRALRSSRMKPRQDRASEGRANPKGIPYLYLANTIETAVAEVRPWIGSDVSLGQFEAIRQLQIINCSHNHSDQSYFFSFGHEPQLSQEEIEKAVWSNIDKAFAAPIVRDDDIAAYAATQTIAELFKSHDYDGLAYRSNFGEKGYNIALFDINAARLLNCELHRVDSIAITSSVQDNAYFVKN